MDTEMIKQLANDVNNVVVATAKPYQEQIRLLQAENKQLKVAVGEAKIKRGQYREIIEALLVPTNFIGIEAARDYICEALEDYGLGKIEKAQSKTSVEPIKNELSK